MKLPIPELKEGEERVSMDTGSQNAENRIAPIRGYAAIEIPSGHVFMITIECQPPPPPPSPEEIEKAMEDSGLIM